MAWAFTYSKFSINSAPGERNVWSYCSRRSMVERERCPVNHWSSTATQAWCFSQVQEILIKQGNRKIERYKLIVICNQFCLNKVCSPTVHNIPLMTMFPGLQRHSQSTSKTDCLDILYKRIGRWEGRYKHAILVSARIPICSKSLQAKLLLLFDT